jgi:excisionase family DNA binding protein
VDTRPAVVEDHQNPPDPEFLTVPEVAARCRTSEETVRRWLRQGRLPSTGVGRRRLVRRADLDRLLTPAQR